MDAEQPRRGGKAWKWLAGALGTILLGLPFAWLGAEDWRPLRPDPGQGSPPASPSQPAPDPTTQPPAEPTTEQISDEQSAPPSPTAVPVSELPFGRPASPEQVRFCLEITHASQDYDFDAILESFSLEERDLGAPATVTVTVGEGAAAATLYALDERCERREVATVQPGEERVIEGAWGGIHLELDVQDPEVDGMMGPFSPAGIDGATYDMGTRFSIEWA